MADRPIAKLYKDIKAAEEGKLFKSFGRAERLKSEYPTGTLRKRVAAKVASMDVRVAKTLEGTSSEAAREARIRQKAALKGVKVGTAGKLLGIAGLPFQYLEFKKMMKEESPVYEGEKKKRQRLGIQEA
jgi:hypothetical protein